MTATLNLKNKEIIDLYDGSNFSVEGHLFPGNYLFLHLSRPEKAPFKVSNYKEMLLAMSLIKGAARNAGIKQVHVFVPADLEKFERMFGFTVNAGWDVPNIGRYFLMTQDT